MNELSRIPQIERIISSPSMAGWIPKLGRPIVLNIIRCELQVIRKSHNALPDEPELLDLLDQACLRRYRKRVLPVINCTGVLIHTNLGRSPISQEVWDASRQVNCSYSSIEFDVDTGKRGNRSGIYDDLMKTLTCGEASLLVNNNAGAVLLLLSALARGKEVIISRSELVQIGGGFRIPDILNESGAVLVEVGTTNITTMEDYVSHINENTAMVLSVHRSNFAIRGFTRSPSLSELAKRLPSHVVLAVDQGSGTMHSDMPGEISVSSHLRMGADIVCFSGDKVLGSVQAGCIVGKKNLIDRMGRHPLYRALRPGKTVVTLFEQTLIERANGNQGSAVDGYSRTCEQMRSLGKKIVRGMDRTLISLVNAPMTFGGGSTPDESAAGMAVEIRIPGSADALSASFRALPVPIIGIVHKDALQLHLGAVFPGDAEYIRDSIIRIVDTFTCTS